MNIAYSDKLKLSIVNLVNLLKLKEVQIIFLYFWGLGTCLAFFSAYTGKQVEEAYRAELGDEPMDYIELN